MHESSLAMSILDIVLKQVRGAGSGDVYTGAVRQIDMCVGEYAGVEANTLTACFEMIALGTPADGAKLVVEKIEASGVCDVCAGPATRVGRILRCPVCEKSSVTLSTGRELFVKSIEVEHPTRRHGHGHSV